jgi:hypothetical protein
MSPEEVESEAKRLYLAQFGHLPGAAAWEGTPETLRDHFRAQARKNGPVGGATGPSAPTRQD